MLKGTTKTGFKYEIGEDVLNNYELVEAIAGIDDNPLLLTKVLDMLLGDRVKRLKEHVRNDDGVVTINALMLEVQDIFSGGAQIKK